MKTLIPSSSAKAIPGDLLEVLAMNNCLEIKYLSDEMPRVWDESFTIEGSNFIIEGAAGPCGFGTARITFPLTAFIRHQYLPLVVTTDHLTQDQVTAITELGWNIS